MSRLKFRNVDADPTDPVSTWPYEGLVTAIERGSLSDWRRIARELRREPWGAVAASLDDYLAYAEATGATALMQYALTQSRKTAHEAAVEQIAMQVRDLVAASGLTRAEFAARAATSPSRLSTYCTGKVTPSAALLLRFEQIANQTQAENLPAANARKC